MDIIMWIFIGVLVALFATVYVLDEIEYSRRVNELIKEGKVIYIFRI